jgi:dihydroorotate dehydrogenase
MSLNVNLFEGFELSNPIWVASSHLSESPKVLEHWQRITPSAITLKTTSAMGGTGQGKRILKQVGHEGSLYSDGSKTKELLDYKTSSELLAIAKKLLPHTKVGSSILMGDNYNECLRLLGKSDFFELNLKYAVRSRTSGDIHSKFETDKLIFENIYKEVQGFLNVFKNYPCFIKFTREIDWIGDFQEFKMIVKLAEQHSRTGIILANTKKWVIPSSSSGLATELEGGIIAGQELFKETYNIVRSVIPFIPDTMPIIATGGIDTVWSIVDMLKTGVKVVQLCTAFQLRGLNYYNHLTKSLNNIQKQLRADSYGQLLKKIAGSEVILLPSLFDYYPSFYDYEFFEDLFRSERLDMVLVYGRTFTRINTERFARRFSTPNKKTRIIMMAPDSPCIDATCYSLDRKAEDMIQKIKEMKERWVELFNENRAENNTLEIYQHNKVPFHSGYISEHRALFVPYSLLGEGQTLPIYEFDVSSTEYKRLHQEFIGLLGKSSKVFCSDEN